MVFGSQDRLAGQPSEGVYAVPLPETLKEASWDVYR
jgi:hypothetical protein